MESGQRIRGRAEDGAGRGGSRKKMESGWGIEGRQSMEDGQRMEGGQKRGRAEDGGWAEDGGRADDGGRAEDRREGRGWRRQRREGGKRIEGRWPRLASRRRALRLCASRRRLRQVSQLKGAEDGGREEDGGRTEDGGRAEDRREGRGLRRQRRGAGRRLRASAQSVRAKRTQSVAAHAERARRASTGTHRPHGGRAEDRREDRDVRPPCQKAVVSHTAE